MTTIRPADPPAASAKPFRLPDIPERHPDDMTSVDSLHRHGAIASIIQYLGHPETTIVSAEHHVVPGPVFVAEESRYPDLVVAFDVNPAAYAASNGYIITQQNKPPDFILEVASRHTAGEDLGAKKDYYEGLGVGEYWLFDSAVLNLNLRAEKGYLGWHDPATGEHIPTLQSQTARVQELEAEIRRLRDSR